MLLVSVLFLGGVGSYLTLFSPPPTSSQEVLDAPPSQRAQEIAQMKGNVDSGQSIYQRECMRCHGEDARGASGPNLRHTFKISNAAPLVDTILEGNRAMSSYDYLSDTELADLVTYLRTP